MGLYGLNEIALVYSTCKTHEYTGLYPWIGEEGYHVPTGSFIICCRKRSMRASSFFVRSYSLDFRTTRFYIDVRDLRLVS